MTSASFAVDSVLVGDGLAVVSVGGEADLDGAPALQATLAAALDAGIARLVVDLTDASFVDSTVLGVLVQGEKRVRAGGGRVALVTSDPNILRVLEITALDRLFATYRTRSEALAAFDGR